MILDLSCVLCLIVFAHMTECTLYVLRDYNGEPFFIDANARMRHNIAESKLIKALSNTVKFRHRAKKNRINKQAKLHFGRHVYHLDNFDDLTKLRSELNPDYISYDYFDINGLIRSRDTGNYVIPLDYLESLIDLSQSSLKPCRGRQCDEDHRKYSDTLKKHKLRKKRHDFSKDTLVKNKAAVRLLKRFKIIDNRHKHKAFKKKNMQKDVSYESTEKYREKRKQNKHHKKQLSSESTSNSNSESNESKESNSDSLEIWKIKRDEYDSDSKSSEESESTEKSKKTFDSFSDSNSDEDKSEIIFSNSIEDRPKKKRKKSIYGSSEEMRKKFEEQQEDLFLQGNKLYNTNNVPDSDEDRRRRLPQFLPKRFHWDPSDIHELGYYWFNGPKGRYPAPTVLL